MGMALRTSDMGMKFAYRLQQPVTVLVEQDGGLRLQQLPRGAVFYTTSVTPDRNGLIQVDCNGNSVRMFSRDLEECAHSIGAYSYRGL